MLALERTARKTRPSELEIWTRRKIFCRIESRIERALPVGVFARRGSQKLFAEELAVPLKTCPLLYTRSYTLKNTKCICPRCVATGGAKGGDFAYRRLPCLRCVKPDFDTNKYILASTQE